MAQPGRWEMFRLHVDLAHPGLRVQSAAGAHQILLGLREETDTRDGRARLAAQDGAQLMVAEFQIAVHERNFGGRVPCRLAPHHKMLALRPPR